jgi:hypothetical protein
VSGEALGVCEEALIVSGDVPALNKDVADNGGKV